MGGTLGGATEQISGNSIDWAHTIHALRNLKNKHLKFKKLERQWWEKRLPWAIQKEMNSVSFYWKSATTRLGETFYSLWMLKREPKWYQALFLKKYLQLIWHIHWKFLYIYINVLKKNYHLNFLKLKSDLYIKVLKKKIITSTF